MMQEPEESPDQAAKDAQGGDEADYGEDLGQQFRFASLSSGRLIEVKREQCQHHGFGAAEALPRARATGFEDDPVQEHQIARLGGTGRSSGKAGYSVRSMPVLSS